ncbi:hypothetical protein PPYR_12951 [Photinus pyralis]|uniref:Transformer n=2 Tax=Photinus pyralis TaxID=7054 RepID=A0A5N4A7M4_PHOPY|nr:serine/arginine repetitive matrix protein 1-like [Photinus pyralis]KAB0793331.1 hypothetical protein PPYR_12951 [Photinus pyralis]
MSKRSRGKESASVSTKGSKEQGGRVRALLTRLSAHDLEGIKVVIRRPYLPDLPTSSPPVIETSLDDPTSLVVHRRGEGKRPIFDREELVVNVEEHLEERIVSTSPVRTRARSGSRSRSRETYKRSYSRSPSIESSPKKFKSSQPSKSEHFRRRSYDGGYPRRKETRRELSPEPGTSKRSKTPDRRGRQYGDSPKRYERKRSRSISPKRPYDRSSTHKYSRPRSKSPPGKRSRSPYSRKRSISPYSKRRQPSPPSRKTPARDNPPPASSKVTRRSRSPDDRNRRGYSSSHRRRTPSPYHRRRSRSPYRPRRRTRSKSPRPTKHSSSSELQSYDETHAADFYYGAEAFWYPDPMLRPRFFPRGMIPPPVALPRGLFRPPPYMVRPYLHTLHPGFRPRTPVRPFRPARPQTPTTTTTTTTAPSENQTTVSTATSSSVVIEECEPEPEADNSVSTEP